MNAEKPFNPLDKQNLGKSVAEALLEQPAHPIGNLNRFEGAGIYAIYFAGNFKAYSLIAEKNAENNLEQPIYVGKAVPAGARKGLVGLDAPAGRVLYSRLREHAESIDAAQNLRVEHFHCKYLVVDDIWIPLGESLLVAWYAPLWNKLIDGFGNHDPGKGRHQQERSRWDTLHPGRAWADKLQARKTDTPDSLAREIGTYLRDFLA